MKFMTVREMRGAGAKLWRELPVEKEMVVTSNGRPIALLSTIEGGDFEASLADLRRARAIRAVTRLQAASLENGTDRLSSEKIASVIAKVRQNRRKDAPCP
jgi:antitoxin (DNA-binding transcriptional repressor) of toxin-antitoxin stability system